MLGVIICKSEVKVSASRVSRFSDNKNCILLFVLASWELSWRPPIITQVLQLIHCVKLYAQYTVAVEGPEVTCSNSLVGKCKECLVIPIKGVLIFYGSCCKVKNGYMACCSFPLKLTLGAEKWLGGYKVLAA